MTKQEIKNKIKALLFGSHATDVKENNALPEILDAITDAAFAGANVQSDWNEADGTKPDFIKNKPDITAADRSVLVNGQIPSGQVTMEALEALGLTQAVFNDLMSGKKSGIKNFVQGSGIRYWPVSFAEYIANDNWLLSLGGVYYEQGSPVYYSMVFYRSNEGVSVSIEEG